MNHTQKAIQLARMERIYAAIAASPVGVSRGEILGQDFGASVSRIKSDMTMLAKQGRVCGLRDGETSVWCIVEQRAAVQVLIDARHRSVRLDASRRREAKRKIREASPDWNPERYARKEREKAVRREAAARRREAALEAFDRPVHRVVPVGLCVIVKPGPASVWELAA